ncbi:MAG: hypothetical protein V3U84_02180 [Thiotrichaceae bacterium]
MNVSKAKEILGFTTKKSAEKDAQLARAALSTMALNAPLRYKVACRTLIDAAK